MVLKVLLLADGKLDRVRVVRRLPYGLTENAIRAACEIKFKPAMKGGPAGVAVGNASIRLPSRRLLNLWTLRYIMKRFIFPLAVSLCLLVAVSQHTTVTAKDTWVSVRTKNFFMSETPAKKTSGKSD